MIFESTTSTMEPLVSAEPMDPRGARREIHDKISFLIKTSENFLRVLHAALNRELSKTLFACLAQSYLAAPFGLEDLGSCDSAGRVGVKDRVDHVTAACPMQ